MKRTLWFVLAAMLLLLVALTLQVAGSAPHVSVQANADDSKNLVGPVWPVLGKMAAELLPHAFAPSTSLVPGTYLAVSAGVFHACALTSRGTVMCWGSNDFGQLGDGTTTSHLNPTDVGGLVSKVTGLSAGACHTCALTLGGAVKCWGSNAFGQLGDGTTIDRQNPVDVTGLTSGVIAISAGGSHTCALTDSGVVKCWGRNADGELGDGTVRDRQTPVDVRAMASGVSAISSGGCHTCALTRQGDVKCWVWNYFGQLGEGTTADQVAPVDVIRLAGGVMALSSGAYHTCALMKTGEVKCWGLNFASQLGDGTVRTSPSPVSVGGLSDRVAMISAGGIHTCALTGRGRVKCWGDNSAGQLGDGIMENRRNPVDVSGLESGVVALSASGDHTCALTSEGDVKCWGDIEVNESGDVALSGHLALVDLSGPVDEIYTPLLESFVPAERKRGAPFGRFLTTRPLTP
jgi:alpha-tubulin suppressor-like RCC1 family protein